MQIAYKDASQLNERRIYLKDVDSSQVDFYKQIGFSYNRKLKLFEALPSVDLLNDISEKIELPIKLVVLFNELVNAQKEINKLKTTANNDIQQTIEAPVKVKLFMHQQKALEMALKRFEVGTGYALLMDLGTGKSLTSISIAGALYQKEKIKRILVACPASIVPVWQNELYKFADFPVSVALLQGDKKKRLDELNKLQAKENCLQVAVINYESTFREGIFEALQKFNADMIICDESQRIKTHNALQSKAMHKLGDNARYKLILSGTPVQNNECDIFSQYRFLDPSIFGKSFYSFKAKYVIMGGFGNHQIIGYKNTDDLIKKAHSIAFRVTKEECLDLPEQIFINREIDFEDKARKAYDSLKRDCVAQISNESTVTANTVLTQILRLQQFTGGFVNDDEGNSKQVSTAKLDALKDILQDYLTTGKKAVIFARFTAELKSIKKLLEKDLKVQYVFIDGSVPLSHRGSIVNTFQTDNDCKIFLAQITTAGLGITLTAASLSIFFSYSYNYADYSQALARIHRIGQKEKCTYINLVVKNTIDAKILKALEHKENTAKSIVDNWRAYFE